MAYIIFVNPTILGDAGMPKEAVFVATCLAAALGTAIMGLYANYPIGMAPGMGLNAYFAYAVVLGMGVPWQSALGAVFISGCLFVLVSVLGLREMIVNGIPHSLRTAITVGIGLFLALIALKSAGLVVASPATLVTAGDLHKPPALMAIFGFLLIVTLDRLKVQGRDPDRHHRRHRPQLFLRRQHLQGHRLGCRRRSRRPSCSSTSRARCRWASSTWCWCSSWSNCSTPPAP